MDRCLWPFTAEYTPDYPFDPLTSDENLAFIRATKRSLKLLKQDGCDIYIASRSTNPRFGIRLIHKYYNEIEFTDMLFFQSPYKQYHINKLIHQDECFTIFDSNPDTLSSIAEQYGSRVSVFHASELRLPGMVECE